jgi:hypothetical protein
MNHDLTSAFATVGLQADLIKKYMPILLVAYNLAVEKRLVEPDLTERQLELIADFGTGLSETIERIKSLVSKAT